MVRLSPFRLMLFGDLDNLSDQWPPSMHFVKPFLSEICFFRFYEISCAVR